MATPAGPPEVRAESAVFSEAYSLIVLLGLFFLIGMIALLAIMQGGETALPPGTAGLQAFGPADFNDEIDWKLTRFQIPATADPGPAGLFPVPPPPFSEDIYPCSDCHDPGDEVDQAPRKLEEAHEEIVLSHAPKELWCFDCHQAQDRDQLHLVNGTPVPFAESHRLCGQCHGTIYRDWRAGIHGRRTGNWDGVKTYLLCAHCHDPHHPKFAPLKPLPPPVRPGYLRRPPGDAAHDQ